MLVKMKLVLDPERKKLLHELFVKVALIKE